MNCCKKNLSSHCAFQLYVYTARLFKVKTFSGDIFLYFRGHCAEHPPTLHQSQADNRVAHNVDWGGKECTKLLCALCGFSLQRRDVWSKTTFLEYPSSRKTLFKIILTDNYGKINHDQLMRNKNWWHLTIPLFSFKETSPFHQLFSVV